MVCSFLYTNIFIFTFKVHVVYNIILRTVGMLTWIPYLYVPYLCKYNAKATLTLFLPLSFYWKISTI
jgi:hypothetical protein